MNLGRGGSAVRPQSTGCAVTRRLIGAMAAIGLAAAPSVAQRPAPVPDVAAAQRAAFPDGMRVTEGVITTQFEQSRLVETSFGPVLVSAGSVEDASHGTPGRLAIHYLRWSGDGYEVERFFPAAVEAGSHGGLSEWAVTRRFTAWPSVYVEGGGTWQGYTCTVATLAELRPTGPVEIADIPIYFDNSGSGRGRLRTVEGRIANIRRGQSFDVDFTGTERFTEHYVYRDGRFVRTSEESRAAC